MRRCGLLQQKSGGADAHREEQQAAQRVGECQWWRAAEDVVGPRLHYMFWKTFGRCDEVAMKMHGSHAATGGAGSECNDVDGFCFSDAVVKLMLFDSHQ